jgi:hypothetical protein
MAEEQAVQETVTWQEWTGSYWTGRSSGDLSAETAKDLEHYMLTQDVVAVRNVKREPVPVIDLSPRR